MAYPSGARDRERDFEERVLTQYRLFSGLFLGLPFERLQPMARLLPVFTDHCRRLLAQGVAPSDIVARFFDDSPLVAGIDPRDALFFFTQLVERQIVLFDALEDASFAETHDLDAPGSVTHLLEAAARANLQPELARLLESTATRIVLTAHPTQFYPTTVQGIIEDLRAALRERDPAEVERLLLQLGKTRFTNRARPSPLEEAARVSDVVTDVFYRVLPGIVSRAIVGAVGREGLAAGLERTPNLQLGFWPGGDRDGNPLVTAEVTEEVAHLLRRRALTSHLASAMALARRLTFEGAHDAVLEIAARLRATLAAGAECADQPSSGRAPYAAPGELFDELLALRGLVERRHQGLFVEHVDDFLAKVRLFGFHLGSLDLRQSSDVLLDALREVAAVPEVSAALPAGDRAALAVEDPGLSPTLATLERMIGLELECPDGAIDRLSPLTRDTLRVLRAIPEIQRRNGVPGLHRWIISHTHVSSDVLVVLALARLAGLEPAALELDVVPLFEAVDDLENAEETLRQLFTCTVYREHLRRRGDRQTVMMGFSDGTKDGGYLTANLAIRGARRSLSALGRRHGVELVFFDGRGGPPARGGGNTHRFYRSRDRGIEQRHQQLTIQGQTISTNFGSPDLARYHVEQIFTANLENLLGPDAGEDPPPGYHALLDELSARARAAYRDLRDDPLLLAFLSERSPLPLFDQLTIASRPVARRRAARLELEQLRAIPFVANWSVLKMQVPGYYGLGTALEAAFAAGREAEVRQLYRESLFFRTLLDNAAMSLLKSRLDLHAHLDADARFAPLYRKIRDETERSRAALLRVSQQPRLMANDPVNRRSIEAREAIVLPLLVIVQYAYLRWLEQQRAGGEPSAELEACRKLSLKGIAAIINATRNAA